MSRIDISDMMNEKFFDDKENIYKGKVLMFEFEGSRTNLRIVRLNRKQRICEVEEVTLYTPEELKDVWEEARNA